MIKSKIQIFNPFSFNLFKIYEFFHQKFLIIFQTCMSIERLLSELFFALYSVANSIRRICIAEVPTIGN